jgi:hypothetical protein
VILLTIQRLHSRNGINRKRICDQL